MDNNNSKGFYAPKSAYFDSAESDGLCFDELEKALNALLEDHTPEPQQVPQPSTSFVLPPPVQEKMNYFRRVSQDIMESKTNFINLFGSINKEIDEVIEKLMCCLLQRQQELKQELNNLAQSKISVFENQLSTCNEVLNKLQIYGLQNFDYIVSDEVIKSLQIHHSDDITFKVPNYSELMCSLQGVGSIVPISEPNSSIGISPVPDVFPKLVIGGNGSGPGYFCRPWGICTDPTGRILVCDRSNHRVQVFNEKGGFIMQIGKEGSRPGEFRLPSGIDVDKKNRIIVSDKDNHRIQVFAYNGAYLFSFGKQGHRPGQFFYPWDVATNSKCDIAVGDSKNHRVQLFDESGQFLMLFDPFKAKVMPPQCDSKMYGCIRRVALKVLDSPRGLVFRPDGSLLVTDLNNHHVLILSPTFDKVTFFGTEGVAPGQFFRPQGIACDRNGHIAISDCKNFRIQIFDDTGKLVKIFGTKGTAPGEFDCPQGISFSQTTNDLLVVDFGNHRVQVF